MNLTESQLFTIEALNRIDGFVWPDKANFADFGSGSSFVFFRLHEPKALRGSFYGGYIDGSLVDTGVYHPDWRNSLITREQFDSVDGWVRLSTGLANPSVMIEGKTVDGVDYWRYVRNEAEDEQPEEKQPSIEDLYEKYQAAASGLIDAQMQVDYIKKQSEEALEQIKKWHQERGFSVSVIGADVSANVNGGGLNVTCGRDLRKGDVVIARGVLVTVIDITDLDGNGKLGFKGKSILGDVYLFTDDEWSFIRRP